MKFIYEKSKMLKKYQSLEDFFEYFEIQSTDYEVEYNYEFIERSWIFYGKKGKYVLTNVYFGSQLVECKESMHLSDNDYDDEYYYECENTIMNVKM